MGVCVCARACSISWPGTQPTSPSLSPCIADIVDRNYHIQLLTVDLKQLL